MSEMSPNDELCINTIRTLSMDAVEKANSGHPGLPMGAAVIAYALWARHLKHNPTNPKWLDRDRFVLSAGHGSMLLYSLLHLTGYELSLDDIKRFRQWGSKTPGHPESHLTPGVEATTGPLGQGTGNAIGMAMAERWLAAHFNRPDFPIVDHRTFALVSDGDMMEGISGEASSLAGHLGLGKLTFLYDNNHITIDGSTSLAFSENVSMRYEAYGWHVQNVDGLDLEAVDAAIAAADAVSDKPSFINCRTIIGYGAPHKAGTNKVHGNPLGKDEVLAAKQALGWPTEPSFYIPEDALSTFRTALDRGRVAEDQWNELFARYADAYPELAAQWRVAQSGQLPKGWDAELPTFATTDGAIATRAAFGKAMNAATRHIPWLIGGSADLAESTATDIEEGGDFEAARYNGRILHWGIREHAMGATLNGLQLHGGVRAFGSTFLVFSDYMRPAVRLAALSQISPIFIWTHDSVGLGEDGPTHQPIEHLPALRAMPNLTLIRPSDATETTVAWAAALEHQGGPIGLVLTRQKLPIIDRTKYARADGLRKGAYVLAGRDDPPELIIIATGSEVQWAIGAYERLIAEGVAARVVSMPCWEFFEQQAVDYRDTVLPPHVTARLAVEMAADFGWSRWVGNEGEVIGINRFGASAPLDDILTHFGFTIDNIVMKAKALLERNTSASRR